MSTLDSFLTWSVIVLPVLLSIFVPFALSHGKIGRYALISGLILLAGLAWWQQVQTRKSYEAQRAEQTTQQRDLKQKLDQSLRAQEYMRGQLDSLAIMVGKVAEKSTDANLKQLAAAIVDASENAARLSQRKERTGGTTVPANATQATIIHGFNDPDRQVTVSALPSWNTTVWFLSQDATSVTVRFNTPAPPGGGNLRWRASWGDQP